MSESQTDRVRLDKWLWAARFFKTRSEATEAVVGGKIEVNGDGVKPAKLVQMGDVIRVRKPPYDFIVTVTGLGERRGSAEAAAKLYTETDESKIARERQAEQIRLAPQFGSGEGKPSRQDRKAWDKLRGKW